MNNQKGIAQIIALIIIVIGLVVGVYLVGQTTDLFPSAKGPTRPVPAPIQKAIQNIEQRMPLIETKEDLIMRLRELESTGTASIEQEVTQNESDAAGM